MSERRRRRRYFIVCAAITTLALALKLPTWFFDRQENDERIYWALTRNWLATGTYSLRGTAILGELPPSVYDRPLFHHPPLFAILLAPFAATDSLRAAILIPWLGHVLAIVGVALICWAWRRRSWEATHLVLWLPVLAVALDPVLTFCSRKLWLDDLVGGLTGLAMGLLCLAAGRRRALWAAAGGTALGLALLTKLSAMGVIPAAVLLLWVSTTDDTKMRYRLIGSAATPVVLLTAPWFAVFYRHYGCFLPGWIRPDEAMIQASGLVRRAVSQPWHYYLTESTLVAPVVLVVLAGYVVHRRRIPSPSFGVPLVWVTLTVVALTVVGLRGQGMQLRFLTIATPGLYAMLAALMSRSDPRRSLLPVVGLLVTLYGAMYAGFFLLDGISDEIQPVPRFLWWRWQAGP